MIDGYWRKVVANCPIMSAFHGCRQTDGGRIGMARKNGASFVERDISSHPLCPLTNPPVRVRWGSGGPCAPSARAPGRGIGKGAEPLCPWGSKGPEGPLGVRPPANSSQAILEIPKFMNGSTEGPPLVNPPVSG